MLVVGVVAPIAGAVLAGSASLAAGRAAEPLPPRTALACAMASATAGPLLGGVVLNLADSVAAPATIGAGAAPGVRGPPSSEADGVRTVDGGAPVGLGCGFRSDASSEPTLAGDDEDGG